MFNFLRLTRPLAILDIETTGLDPANDRIVEVAVIKYTPDGQQFSAVQRLHPGIPIPPAATALHGIGDADVVDQPSFVDVAAPLLDYLADCDLAGFGLKRFDLPFLCSEFGRVGRELPMDGRAIVDVLEIFHRQEKRDLGAGVRRYCNREHPAAHSAVADAAATAEVLDNMLACYPDLPTTAAGLDAAFRDPDSVDRDGRFVRHAEQICFAFGRHRGQPVAVIARLDPGYLRWMLSAGFSADTLEIVREALRQADTAASTLLPCRRPAGDAPALARNPVTA